MTRPLPFPDGLPLPALPDAPCRLSRMHLRCVCAAAGAGLGVSTGRRTVVDVDAYLPARPGPLRGGRLCIASPPPWGPAAAPQRPFTVPLHKASVRAHCTARTSRTRTRAPHQEAIHCVRRVRGGAGAPPGRWERPRRGACRPDKARHCLPCLPSRRVYACLHGAGTWIQTLSEPRARRTSACSPRPEGVARQPPPPPRAALLPPCAHPPACAARAHKLFPDKLVCQQRVGLLRKKNIYVCVYIHARARVFVGAPL